MSYLIKCLWIISMLSQISKFHLSLLYYTYSIHKINLLCVWCKYLHICSHVPIYVCMCVWVWGSLKLTWRLWIIPHSIHLFMISQWSQSFQFQLLSPCKLRSQVDSTNTQLLGGGALGVKILVSVLAQQWLYLLGHCLKNGFSFFYSNDGKENILYLNLPKLQ